MSDRKAWVIRANDAVEAVVLTSEADAELVRLRLKDEDKLRNPYDKRIVYWRAVETAIVEP